ncbi:hypothetical protein MKK69_23180 [Methylobacterium sp. J-026]|uniref:hypothetical protein n=1 Tax=Methylobacterium sp. J-026 TaxID=2836624 RepID=UPI001FBAB9C5|nr:hypothetical protein [Methylobacterium sp. J-026]MCJ2136917.1 hypothetical protein [Methylobacterium sp. J-026]
MADVKKKIDLDREPSIRPKDVLCIIAMAAWSMAVLAIEHPVRQAPPIVSYLSFTSFQMR